MTVVVISKLAWDIRTHHNVTSITYNSNGTYTIVGDSTETYSGAYYYIRIMES